MPAARLALVSATALLLAALPAQAADPQPRLIDHSNGNLIDEATAKKILTENIPAKVNKIHAFARHTFVSQVEGGFTEGKVCVVTARVMMLPLTAAMKAPLFRPLPKMTATAFDAIPGATAEQCKAAAADKLKAATQAVVSSIVKS